MRSVGLIGICIGVTGTLMACSSSSGGGGTDSGVNGDTHVSGDTGPKKGDAGTDAKKGDGGKVADTGPGVDSSHNDVVTTGTDSGGKDTGGGTKDSGHDAGPTGPEQLLVTFGNGTYTQSQLVAINLTTKATSGTLTITGSATTDTHNGTAPFLLETSNDTVARLDSTSPWKVDATWSTSLTPDRDGAANFQSFPVGVVVETGTKAYILRTDRNDIAVIDESVTGEAGVPMTPISLAGLQEPGDTDGSVEVLGGAYVASSKRLYLVLGNILQPAMGGAISNPACTTGLTSTVTAIDTTTDMIVNLGGQGPKGSVELKYYAPTNVVYDAAGNRLIIVSQGCNATASTATARGIEAFNLMTNSTASLLALNPDPIMTPGFNDPVTSFAYIDATHAVIGFDGTGQGVVNWDPTKTTLGGFISNAPDTFTYDGHGNLVGVRTDTSDAGVMKQDIVSVAIATGVSTTIASNVSTLTSPHVESVDVWPHP